MRLPAPEDVAGARAAKAEARREGPAAAAGGRETACTGALAGMMARGQEAGVGGAEQGAAMERRNRTEACSASEGFRVEQCPR